MQKCWEIESANRITFEKLVPELEDLVSDTHKEVNI